MGTTYYKYINMSSTQARQARLIKLTMIFFYLTNSNDNGELYSIYCIDYTEFNKTN